MWKIRREMWKSGSIKWKKSWKNGKKKKEIKTKIKHTYRKIQGKTEFFVYVFKNISSRHMDL